MMLGTGGAQAGAAGCWICQLSSAPRWVLKPVEGCSGFQQLLVSGSRRLVVMCSTRNLPRGLLWRGRNISREAILTVQSLKWAKRDGEELKQVLKSQVCRLIKFDMLQVLHELQRQNECPLAYEVFKLVRKEIWYKPEALLYRNMIDVLGKNRMMGEVEKLFKELQEEGLFPDAMLYTELIAAYLRNERPLVAIETFEEMKQLGLELEEKTYRILIKGLEKKGLDDCAAAVKAEYLALFPHRKDEPEQDELNHAGEAGDHGENGPRQSTEASSQ